MKKLICILISITLMEISITQASAEDALPTPSPSASILPIETAVSDTELSHEPTTDEEDDIREDSNQSETDGESMEKTESEEDADNPAKDETGEVSEDKDADNSTDTPEDNIAVNENMPMLTMTQNVFCVSVPTNLPVTRLEDGGMVYSTDISLFNQGNVRARISSVQVIGLNGWTLANYYTDYAHMPVNLKSFGLSLNGYPVADTGEADLTGFPVLEGNTSYNFQYSASLAVQSEPINDATIANVVFTVESLPDMAM